MQEYVLLAAALTCAAPYGYLIVAILVLQPRQLATYVTVVGLLALWPTCVFMSFLQLIPVLAMSTWWWSNDFSAADVFRQPVRFKRPIPTGLLMMLLVTIFAALASGAYGYWLWTLEAQQTTLRNNTAATGCRVEIPPQAANKRLNRSCRSRFHTCQVGWRQLG